MWKLFKKKKLKHELKRGEIREKMINGFSVCSNWQLGNFEVLDYKLIELYKEKGYFGKLPWISQLEQRAILFHWKNEMRERGWDFKKSIYDNQDLFESDCERCLSNAMDLVLNKKGSECEV